MERHERKAKHETRRGWIKEFNSKFKGLQRMQRRKNTIELEDMSTQENFMKQTRRKKCTTTQKNAIFLVYK